MLASTGAGTRPSSPSLNSLATPSGSVASPASPVAAPSSP